MPITYLDKDQSSSPRIVYLDRPQQTSWEATKAVLGSRPELRPYGTGQSDEADGTLESALSAAGETLSAPIRTGATLNRAFGFPEDIGNATGFPKTGKMVSAALPFFVGPGGKTPLPKTGVGREAAVSAADELSIPISRAERTGSSVAGGLEAALEKTPLGSGVIRDARQATTEAADAAKGRYSQEMGTSQSPSVVGMKAKEGYLSEMGEAKGLRDKLYGQVPDNVYVPINKAKQTAGTLLDEQGKLYDGTQSPEVLRWVKIVQDAETSSGKGVTGGPEVRGVTTQTADQVIPPQVRNVNSSLVGAKGEPLSYQEKMPGKTIPGRTEYGVEYGFGPEEKFAQKPNYFALKKLRGNLSEAIGQAESGGRFSDLRDLTRLKAALDADIESFANSSSSPLDSMVGQEFKRTYGQANAYNKGFEETYRNPDVLRLLNTDPEKIVGSIFRPNNVTEIQRFRAAIGEDSFLQAKRQFTQDLLDASNLRSSIDKHSGIMGTVYTPTEIEKLTKLADVMDLIKKSRAGFENPSGTARQIIGGGSWTAAGYALGAGNPGVALSILGLPYLASKALVKSATGIPNPAARIGIGVGSNLERNR